VQSTPIEPLSNRYGRTTDASLAFLGPSRYNCVGGVVTFPVREVIMGGFDSTPKPKGYSKNTAAREN
jgi:hypothetical protein